MQFGSKSAKVRSKSRGFSKTTINKLEVKSRKGKIANWVFDEGQIYRTLEDEERIKSDFLEDVKNRKVMRKGNLFIDGVTSKYLGRHPIRNNTRPQKFFKPHYSSNIFYEKFRRLFDEHEIDVNKNLTIEGCWHTNKHTLQRQMVPNVDILSTGVPTEASIQQLMPSVHNILRKLKISTLEECTENDMLYCQYNKKTFPGFSYEQMGLATNKGQVVEKALTLAKERWRRIESGNFSHDSIMPSLYTIGARNKRDFSYDNGESATSRVVHMPEFHAELTSGVWTDRITEHCKETKRGPIFIGNSYLEFERLEKTLENSIAAFEGDWKRYDSSLYISIIICAVAVLRCFFTLNSSRIDNHFIAIFDCVGIKDYYTPGGHTYRLMHGLPSGVKSTNLIGTIINLIALDWCCGIRNSKKIDFIAGGDDFIISLRSYFINFADFEKEFLGRAATLGMQVKFFKEKFLDSSNLEELPCFYKYVVKDNEPSIPISAMLERVFLPWNKRYKDFESLFDFTFDVMPSLGKPRTHLLVYYLYISYLSSKVLRSPLKIKDVYKMHERLYVKMMNKKENFSQFKSKTDYSMPILNSEIKKEMLYTPKYDINYLFNLLIS